MNYSYHRIGSRLPFLKKNAINIEKRKVIIPTVRPTYYDINYY